MTPCSIEEVLRGRVTRTTTTVTRFNCKSGKVRDTLTISIATDDLTDDQRRVGLGGEQ